MNIKTSHPLWNIQVCARLIWRDMVVFRPYFYNRLVNSFIWVAITTLVFQYIGFGDTSENIGLFMVCASAGNAGFFEVMDNVCSTISDLHGGRSITYALTLPVSQSVVFVRIALSNALQGMAIALFILPLSKLLLWNHFRLGQLSIPKTLLIFTLSQLFYGFFSLWLICMIKNVDAIGNVWNRVIFPLWYLGCYQFTWATFFEKCPPLACLSLALNPLVYCIEGTRAAVMGQEGYLPFWWCCIALIFFTTLVGAVGTIKMKQKLDCL